MRDEELAELMEILEGIGAAILKMKEIDEDHETPGVMSVNIHQRDGRCLSIFLTVNPEQAAAIMSVLPRYEVIQ